MDVIDIINLIFIIVCSLTALLSAILLCIFFVHHRQCFNFPTLLSGNTILAIFIYSSVSMVAAIYMMNSVQGIIGDSDFLCGLRAYFQHVSISGIHHSLVLQALEKYFKVKKVTLLETVNRQIAFVAFQWLLDIVVILPVFLTDNLSKMPFGNVCFLALSKIHIVFILVSFVFYSTDISLAIIYRNLVHFVRQASVAVSGPQQLRMNRDLTMVRRIVMLNTQMAIMSLPSVALVILAIVRMDLVAREFFIFAFMLVNGELFIILLLLTWMTPKLRQCITDMFIKVHHRATTTSTRVTPITNTART